MASAVKISRPKEGACIGEERGDQHEDGVMVYVDVKITQMRLRIVPDFKSMNMYRCNQSIFPSQAFKVIRALYIIQACVT